MAHTSSRFRRGYPLPWRRVCMVGISLFIHDTSLIRSSSNSNIELYQASDMLLNIQDISGDSANSVPLIQPPHTHDQPANTVRYNITCIERNGRRNIRYDSSGDYPHAYSPVFEDIANIDGVISCLSVSMDGLANSRFRATIELDLEQDCKDKSPRHMEVGRQIRKCLGRYGVQCHVAGKHVDAGA